ncbi:hypothetical protein KN825_16100, partial [Weizmannia coagulans]|nr:hypothetical protein [Heyndrickxia coagulans]
MGSNPKEWWVDTGATRHVCCVKKMFSTFEPIEIGEKVFIGNSTTLTLTNILYVPEILKNLVFGSLPNNHGFKMVFE